MFTTAGSAGFSTDANPLLKLPSDTGDEFRAIVSARFDAPKTSWPDQFLSPIVRTPPPISAARTTTVATQRGMCKSLLFMAVSFFDPGARQSYQGFMNALDEAPGNSYLIPRRRDFSRHPEAHKSHYKPTQL